MEWLYEPIATSPNGHDEADKTRPRLRNLIEPHNATTALFRHLSCTVKEECPQAVEQSRLDRSWRQACAGTDEGGRVPSVFGG